MIGFNRSMKEAKSGRARFKVSEEEDDEEIEMVSSMEEIMPERSLGNDLGMVGD